MSILGNIGGSHQSVFIGGHGIASSGTAPAPAPTPTTPPVDGAILQTFSMSNWAAAPSTGRWRQGIPFRQGQVPAGSSVQVQFGGAAVAVQFDERRSWPDGSLAFAVMHGRDTDLPGGVTRSYMVRLAAGVPFDNTGTLTLAAITGAHDFKVAFGNMTETGDAGPAQAVGSGAFLAGFNAHMAVATRRTKHHQGAVCEGWTGWGMAADATGGAADPHLKTYWHGDVWKNADGSTYAVEIAGEPAQDWWSTANKRRRTYDAALLDGGTTIQAYPGVAHHYHSSWLTCQNKGGHNRGKRHWIGGPQPTLTYMPDRAYWIAAGYVPPLNLATPRTSMPVPGAFSGNAVYVPCSSQNHREQIDGTGAYAGRGVITQPDNIAFLNQLPADVAAARLNGHAGMHVPFRHRSTRMRTRPGEAADIASTQISLILARTNDAPLPGYDFTAAGMPAPVHAYYDGRTSAPFMDGFVPAQGGFGVWSQTTGDASHAVNYSYFMYLLEGERYHMEATLDLANNVIQQQIGEIGWGRPYVLWGQGGAWDAIAQVNGQDRSFGWGMNLIGSAAGIVPDAHPASGYFQRLNLQQNLFCIEMTGPGLSDDWRHAGSHPYKDADCSTAPWMNGFNVLGCLHNWRLTGNAGAKAWAAFMGNWAINHTRDAISLTYTYRAANKRKMRPHDPVTNPYVPITLANGTSDPVGSIVGSTGVVTINKPLPNGSILYIAAKNLYFIDKVVPPELTEGVPHYVVNASGSSFQLSASLGGPPITFSADYPDANFLQDLTQGNDTTGQQGTNSNPDDTPGILRACVVDLFISGVLASTQALVDKSQHYNNADTSGWASWDYAVPGSVTATLPARPTPVPDLPGPVTGIAASNVTFRTMTVGWTATTTGGEAAGYSVRYRPSGGTWSTPLSVTGTGTQLAGLTAATAYDVEVTGVNVGGAGPAVMATLSTVARPTSGYIIDVRQQQSDIYGVHGNAQLDIHVSANVDDGHPASVLIGVTLAGTQPSNPASTGGGGYDPSGWQTCAVINYGGDTYYEAAFRLDGHSGTWTWVIQTPDGVHQAVPGAAVVVIP